MLPAMAERDDDIFEVMLGDLGRGRRRPRDAETRRRERELLSKFRLALAKTTEKEFLDAIRELGFSDPGQLHRALRIFRAFARL